MKHRVMPTASAAIAAACTWLCSSAVLAFQSPMRYLEPAETGGGGGRFFTGSPSDRYTCKVCHTRGNPLEVKVSGLPVKGYEPGKTYRLLIDWGDTLKSVAFNLEMTDRAGRAAGAFAVPPLEQLTPADLCPTTMQPALFATPAGQGPMGMAARTLALLSECGAMQATLDWTAPTPGTDPDSLRIGPDVWFSGSLVSADADGTVIGDTVVDFSRVIALKSEGTPASTNIKSGCQVVTVKRATRPTPLAWLSAGFVVLFACARRRLGAAR